MSFLSAFRPNLNPSRLPRYYPFLHRPLLHRPLIHWPLVHWPLRHQSSLLRVFPPPPNR